MESQFQVRVAVVGVGALGTELLFRLASDPRLAPFVGEVLLIDPETIEHGNLPVSRLFSKLFQQCGPAILGNPKAVATARFLSRFATSIRWTPCPVEFADLSWARLASLDLLLCCADNALVRLEIALAARALRLPVLDSAILGGPGAESGLGGRISWYLPFHDSACSLCQLSAERRAELLAFASTPSLGCRSPTVLPMGADPMVSPSLQQIAATVLEQLRSFINDRRPGLPFSSQSSASLNLRRLEGVWRQELHNLPQSPSCPWHEPPFELISAEPDTSLADVLLARTHPADGPYDLRLQFAWPVCLLARCRRCGTLTAEPQRLALLRRRARCRSCGAAHQLEPLQTVASVGHNDPVARRSPRQLGWSDRQLFQLRPALRPAAGERQP